MKNLFISISVIALMSISCAGVSHKTVAPAPDTIKLEDIAQNPEGIEFNKNDNTFLLSSLNAGPIIKVSFDGTFKSFTSGEKFPVSSAGLHIDYKRNRLLVAGFDGTAAMDNDPTTKGISVLRVYNLKTGVIEQDINLSSLAPDANAYFANDTTVDNEGNVYISDWYANLVYKVDINGKPSIFWKNTTGLTGAPNGLDFHPDGYLLVSLIKINEKGLYSGYGLVKIPIDDPKSASTVSISDSQFAGFDGMVINAEGNVIGVTNNQKVPGGNMLIELSGNNNWQSAKVINAMTMTSSTTVAVTPDNKHYVINQDFSDPLAKTWTIERIKF